MLKTEIKAKRYKKAKNIINNNLSREEKGDYEASRKHGLVRIRNTKKSKK